MHGQIRIGISGWTYAPWRGVFYPKNLPRDEELHYASRQLGSIEINGTFYGLQRPEIFQRWYSATPEDFVFSVKGSRFITHIQQARETRRPLANFFSSGLLALREKLGPILWQFPPTLAFDPETFDRFFSLLPRTFAEATDLTKAHDSFMSSRTYAELPHGISADRPIRHAIEIRNESFRCPKFVKLLRRHRLALVFADSSGKWPYFEDLSADFVYLRLHGKGQMYVGGYDPTSLGSWAGRILSWREGRQPRDAKTLVDTYPRARARDAFVYFDNDVKVHAPFNAISLREILEKQTTPEQKQSIAERRRSR